MIETEKSPELRRLTRTIMWAAWLILIGLWAWYLTTQPYDRTSLMLGFLTGCILSIWSIEISGNKVPESWTGGKRRVRK